jgi:Ni/Fe-hydrogenase subunit HybB-like protein
VLIYVFIYIVSAGNNIFKALIKGFEVLIFSLETIISGLKNNDSDGSSIPKKSFNFVSIYLV